MDVVNIVAVLTRVLLLVFAVVLSFAVYNIYRKTRGGSKGWLYMCIAFVSVGAWSVSQLVFLYVFDTFMGRVVISAVMFFMISLFNPLAAINLARDMKCSLPPWLTERNVIILCIAFFAAMYSYNIFASPGFAGSVAGISMFSMVLMFSLAVVGYMRIAKETGVRFWSWFAWGCIIAIIGAFMITTSYTDCCGTGAPLNGAGECGTWMYDYSPILPLPCIAWALPLTSNSAVFVDIGIILLLIAIEKMRRAMKG